MEVEENSETHQSTKNTEAGNKKKQKLDIDYKSLFPSNDKDDEASTQYFLASDNSPVGDHQRRRSRKKSAANSTTDDGGASASSGGDNVSTMSDFEIKTAIERTARFISTCGPKLPDKGVKLNSYLQKLKEESERRKQRKSQEDANGCKKPAHAASANSNGALDECKGLLSSSPCSKRTSHFESLLRKKLKDDAEPNSEQNTGDQQSNAFDDELSYLNHGDKWKDNNQARNVFDHEAPYMSGCDKRKRKSVGQSLQSKRTKPAFSSKGFSAWKPATCSRSNEKYISLNGKLSGRSSLMGSLPLSKEKPSGSDIEKDVTKPLNPDQSKNQEDVVLVDEEEPELLEREQDAEQLPPSVNEGKIYYPSREDPESLEIFRSELKCLEPGECLTSTIMNFYIRFLQESSRESLECNFYFFNTYFYSKLQKAISNKQKSDKEVFGKFRRWWKGVNIFQKAYIFLPINEDNHWSLVIICIPDKEDEPGDSGLIMLHLDSLGLHSSASIFYYIKRLLINEWEYLNGVDGVAVQILISERIWKNLPRRIEEKTITVPRQTNDYDCGLFVLYYMERFILEAPDRLKRQHLTMFGKSWFKPQEASSLRGKIKKILLEKFHAALQKDTCVWQPVCLSANAEAAQATNHVEIS
uniref:UB-like protease 1D n=1 Tax=Sesuvium portulacastrum TaxID=221166 RepID=A0A2I7ZAP8_SESPO|nr:UB-like protease 1D [Sesuvium portulacastrum]